MLGTTIVSILTIIACEFESTKEIDENKKVVDDIEIELNAKTYQINHRFRITTFPSETGNVGQIKTLDEIGYATLVNSGITYEYTIASFDDVFRNFRYNS